MQAQFIDYCNINSLHALKCLILYIYNSGCNCQRSNDINCSFWLSSRLVFNQILCYRHSRQSRDLGFLKKVSLEVIGAGFLLAGWFRSC